jgi:hypothetical protein
MAEYAEWRHKFAVRQLGKQQQPKTNFPSVIDTIISGRDPGLDGMILSPPKEWEKQFADWESAVQRQGDKKRLEELAVLHLFFRLKSNIPVKEPETLLTQAEHIRSLAIKSNSPVVQSFVLGSLGATLMSHGLAEMSFHLTQEALAAAKRGDLKWAELQWAMNLALFRVNNAPRESDKELRRLLSQAHKLGDHKKIGAILNNLAFVNERFLSNLIDAISFQEEAVAIARATADKVSELGRLFHLANMQEHVGQIQPALKNYDRGLAIEATVGVSEIGFDVFRRVTHLITSQYREKTRKILASHMTVNQAPHSKGDIRKMLEEAQKGAIMMSSWDPSLGSINIKPEHSFAKELSLHQEWQALSVYAYQWMDQGLLLGDAQGFHWLAVAMQSLGYPGIATWALTMAKDLSKAMKRFQT